MKTAIMKIIQTVWAFIKAHAVVSIVIGAVVITAAIATPITVHWLNEQKQLAHEPPDEPKLSEQDENSLQSDNEQNPNINDEPDDPTKEEENPQEMDEPQPEPTETPDPETNTPQNNNVVSNENPETPQNSSGHTEKNEQGGLTIYGPDYDPNKPQAVQRANPDTGISWDGKSPIVYTYPDGTTGTTPQDGAQYEYFPGMWTTLILPKDDAGRYHGESCPICGKTIGLGKENTCSQASSLQYCTYCGVRKDPFSCHTCLAGSYKENVLYCEYCGRLGGDGLNGTCLRYWAVGEHSCFNCGEAVPTNTCHICTSGCMYCKKPLGNGTNGTCYRDYFGSSNCPSCNVSVEIDTCHSCS